MNQELLNEIDVAAELPDDVTPATPEETAPQQPDYSGIHLEQPTEPVCPRKIPVYLQQNYRRPKAADLRADSAPKSAGENVPSTLQYFVMQLVMALPLVGLIVSIVWGLSEHNSLYRRNYARANLLMLLVRVVLRILVIILVFSLFGMGISQMINYFMGGHGPYSYYGPYGW